MRGWIITIVLTLIGGLTRLWNVGSATDHGTPLFDEKYYAVQAAEVLRNNGVEDNQSYGVVVHPPLGKQLIAIGEKLFGYTPLGWRFASVIAGTMVIFLMIRVVRRLTRSTLMGGIAGVLIICDGVSFVMARTALLDVFQEVFILAAFACLIADREQTRARLNASGFDTFVAPERTGFLHFWRRWGDAAGVALGARWWRFGCGIFMGLTMAIKYNGVYWIAAFGVMSVVWDITARREIGVRRPVVAVLRRDVAHPCGPWSSFRSGSTSRPGGPGCSPRTPFPGTGSWVHPAIWATGTAARSGTSWPACGTTRCGSGPGRCWTSTPPC